jgi:HK97 gp10 family phage protein
MARSGVEGSQRLRSLLARLPDKARTAMRVQMEASATKIVEMMKSLAPEDTGALVRSIGWTWGDAPTGSTTLGRVAPGKGSGMRITIYAGSSGRGPDHAFYAAWQEFGTEKMAAQPYFYPSWRANRSHVRRAITRAASRAMKNG